MLRQIKHDQLFQLDLQPLFKGYEEYGKYEYEYGIDSSGKPYVLEYTYHILFCGPGDHWGTPDSIDSQAFSYTTFESLRKAAEKYRKPEFANINEKNWRSFVCQKPGKK